VSFRDLLNDKPGKSVLVIGYGKTGQSAVDFFRKMGVDTVDFDDNKRENENIVSNVNTIDFASIVFAVQSPCIPTNHQVRIKAIECNIPIFSDIDIFLQATPHALHIGVTGTNGKSTTTALIGHVLSTFSDKVFVCGNIGSPALSVPIFEDSKGAEVEHTHDSLLSHINSDCPVIYVIELSSYQLELSNVLHFDIGVLTNIAEDHLARHGTIEKYIAAKEKLLAFADICAIGLNDDYSTELLKKFAQKFGKAFGAVVFDMMEEYELAGIKVSSYGKLYFSVRNGILNSASRQKRTSLFSIAKRPYLLGAHNEQNIVLAYMAAVMVLAKLLGVSFLELVKKIASMDLTSITDN
jgi:UDP-N-acetylmuramoylalanine--D-glutamate ligase